MSLKLSSLKIATSQLGVQEEPRGSNDGPEVSQYLKAVGLAPGYSWCMAFVYWCAAKAANRPKDNKTLWLKQVASWLNGIKRLCQNLKTAAKK